MDQLIHCTGHWTTVEEQWRSSRNVDSTSSHTQASPPRRPLLHRGRLQRWPGNLPLWQSFQNNRMRPIYRKLPQKARWRVVGNLGIETWNKVDYTFSLDQCILRVRDRKKSKYPISRCGGGVARQSSPRPIHEPPQSSGRELPASAPIPKSGYFEAVHRSRRSCAQILLLLGWLRLHVWRLKRNGPTLLPCRSVKPQVGREKKYQTLWNHRNSLQNFH